MKIEGIDHVHIEVAERDRAAKWYARVLGLVRHERLAVWADDPMGPLILATQSGAPVLSLFTRGCAAPSRDATIAYRVGGESFLRFLEGLPSDDVRRKDGTALTPADAVDHDLSWSIYFADPDVGSR